MIYSSTAAIHAIVAAAAALTQLTTRLTALQKNYEAVLIDGPSQTGRLEQASPDGPVWLPVLPMVYEPDADAVLAIVGFAFLCLLPMQVRSKTLRNVKPEQKTIVLVWRILLFVGIISALLVDIFVTIWFFPQLGFCPPDQADTLPMFSNGPPVGLKSWDRTDWYRWNRTVSDHFIFNNSSVVFPNDCIYPCSEFPWPIRDPTDIIIVHHSLSDNAPISAEFVVALYIAACVVVGLFAGATITVLCIRRVSARFQDVGVRTVVKEFRKAWSSRDYSGVCILTLVTFAQWPSIITCLFFIAVKEYSLWWGGLQEQTFRHIGQWGILVGSLLLFVAGWSGRGELASTSENERQRQQKEKEQQEKEPQEKEQKEKEQKEKEQEEKEQIEQQRQEQQQKQHGQQEQEQQEQEQREQGKHEQETTTVAGVQASCGPPEGS
jgi:hypothetical protein